MKINHQIFGLVILMTFVLIGCGSNNQDSKKNINTSADSLSASEKVIPDGLILHLDASDSKSYSGTGLIWKDLSGQGNDGKLINAPIFNKEGVKSFKVTSGSKIDINAENLKIDAGTWSIWFKTANENDNFSEIMTLATQNESLSNGGHIYIGNSHAYFAAKNSGNNFITKNNDFGMVANDSWHNLVLTYKKNDRCIGYLDGKEAFSANLPNWQWTSSKVMRICGRWSKWSQADEFSGNVAQVNIYNRTLTSTEVLKNFETFKKRFNL
jgi:hypothetical protein